MTKLTTMKKVILANEKMLVRKLSLVEKAIGYITMSFYKEAYLNALALRIEDYVARGTIKEFAHRAK